MTQRKRPGVKTQGGRCVMKASVTALAVALLAGLVACGSGSSSSGGDGGGAIPAPVILTLALPDGVTGIAYTAGVSVRTALIATWSVSAGSLPGGLSLNSTNGQITGTPTAAGTFTFTVKVTDTLNQSDTQDYTVKIADPMDERVERVSVAADGSEANGDSGTPALSEDGRFVAFTSFADNLIAGDTNGFADVYLRDRMCNTTIRVSVASDGTEANSQSFSPVLSRVVSGRLFVAYASDATNLVSGDTNMARDVFVTVLDVGSCPPSIVTTARVSVASDGTEGTGNSQLPNLAENGLKVAYTSAAGNLVEADNNLQTDSFVTDLSFDGVAVTVLRTQRISLFQGRVAVAIQPTTANIFSDTTIGRDDLTLTPGAHVGREVFITGGVGINQLRTITANDATTLTVDPSWTTTPDDTSVFRILTRDEFTVENFSDTTVGNASLALIQDEGINSLVEITTGTGEGQQRRITTNDATTFTITPAWDPLPDASSRFRILRQGAAASQRPQLSGDGQRAVFDSSSQFEVEDRNAATDIFLRDLATAQTARVSLTESEAMTNGASDGGSLTADGSLLLFRTSADNFFITLPPTTADVFSSTTIGNTTLNLTPDSLVDQGTRILEGTGAGQVRTITANTATTLTVDPAWTTTPDATSVFQVVPDNNIVTDLYIRDLGTGTLERVTVATDGTEADRAVDLDARMSRGGRLVAFSTLATNLDADDRNAVRDVYLRDRQAGETRRLSVGLGGTNPAAECVDQVISFDGSTVAFSSVSSNLVVDDTNAARDVFLVDTSVIDPAPPPVPIVLSATLPPAKLSVAYQGTFKASGGTPPFFWAVTAGTLPPGVFLDATSGRLTGVPQQPGRFTFTISVVDTHRPLRHAQKSFTLVVGQ